MDFLSLDSFFSLSPDAKNKTLFQWGQTHLLSLQGKQLEKACSELTHYFRNHPQIELCPNLITPHIYWREGENAKSHHQLNYSFKEYMMNVIIYKKCDYISFQDDGSLVWDTDSKKPRFIYKDIVDKKTEPDREIKQSHFSLRQKDILWTGISVGFLDVPYIEVDKKRKIK